MIPPDLWPYLDEFDNKRSPQERAEARKRRVEAEHAAELAARQAAADQLRATGVAPAGWIVTRHVDAAAGCSLGVDLGDGYRIIRESEVEIAGSVGWTPASWPPA